jgi:hypothetical protein
VQLTRLARRPAQTTSARMAAAPQPSSNQKRPWLDGPASVMPVRSPIATPARTYASSFGAQNGGGVSLSVLLW